MKQRRAVTNPLTERQRECLLIIVRSIETTGLAPTTREIGAAMKIASPNAVASHLEALMDKKFIEVMEHRARGIVVCGAVWTLKYAPDEAGKRLRDAIEQPQEDL